MPLRSHLVRGQQAYWNDFSRVSGDVYVLDWLDHQWHTHIPLTVPIGTVSPSLLRHRHLPPYQGPVERLYTLALPPRTRPSFPPHRPGTGKVPGWQPCTVQEDLEPCPPRYSLQDVTALLSDHRNSLALSGVPPVRLWQVLLFGWLFWFIFFLDTAQAGTVVAKNVVIAGPYGRLTALVDNSMASFTTYANGTIYFDIQGNELFQGVYQFTVQSYGNGTLQLRFKGMEAFEVRATPATSAYESGDAWQQLTYTANQTSPLVLVFSNPRLSLRLGSWIAALMLTVIVVIRLSYSFSKGEVNAEEMNSLRKQVFIFAIIVFAFFFLGLLFP